MYSPGRYHRFVPKDPIENLHFRRWVLRRCRKDDHFRLAIYEACRTDILFWVNCMVWQFNPRKKEWPGEAAPFITWDFQDRALLKKPNVPWPGDSEDLDGDAGLLWAIEHDQDLVIEKSREMGASWLCLLVMYWLWLFHPRKKFLCISRNEASVDEPGEPDSLFWKLDFVWKYLPDWMRPRGWRAKSRQKLSFVNPENGSAITGQASTGKAGVGGRATAMFV